MGGEILTIKLTGIAGFSKGKEFTIEEGGEAVIGRSRDCSFRIGQLDEPEPDLNKPFKGTGGKDDHLHTVSRHHVKLTFQNAKSIFIQDQSKHGTFLNGITRQTVLQMLKERGVEVIERHIEPGEMEGFEQCWLTGTAAEVTPVGSIGEFSFEVGALTRSIAGDYEKLVRGQFAAA